MTDDEGRMTKDEWRSSFVFRLPSFVFLQRTNVTKLFIARRIGVERGIHDDMQ